MQFFDGVATFEEISYRTGMARRELDKMVQLFPDDVSTQICRRWIVADTSSSHYFTHSTQYKYKHMHVNEARGVVLYK